MCENKKILITGGSGMVGSQIGFGIKPTHRTLDLTRPKTIEKTLDKYRPDIVLHLAAFTDMLKAERYPKEAYKINVDGTYNLALSCQKRDIYFVYLSTCAVFNGKKQYPYNEKDVPLPVNVYGKTKWLGEKVVQKIIPKSLIIRTGWLFGGNSIDKKFVKTCFEKCLRGELIKATFDRFGSPTYIPDLITKVKQFIDNNTSGIIHVVNSGQVSYFEIAKLIKKLTNSHTVIKPVRAKDVESPLLKRGVMEALISEKIHLRPWQQALQEYIKLLLFDRNNFVLKPKRAKKYKKSI